MKKFFITSLAILVSIFCYPQSDRNTVAYQSKKVQDNVEKILNASFSEISTDDVNTKAARSFNKQFENVTTAKWYKLSDGFAASFTENEIETKVLYDFNGNWHCTLRTYGEKQLPFDVKDLVKSKYYDYNILVVYEITYPRTLTYILKIEDSKKIKTLRVADGEMKVIGDYVRG